MSTTVTHLDRTQLEAGLPEVAAAPKQDGVLRLIVRRPAEDQRDVMREGELDVKEGLVGDNWIDGYANPECQLTLMNSRAAQLVAQAEERWPLAGDQLYVDFDIGEANLPAGTRVAIGATAVIEVTAEPHTGCSKFVDRFGLDAMKFVNSPEGRALNLRGINSKVITGGVIRVGDTLRKLD